MDPRQLELATAFCQKMGASDLCEYLGLDQGAPTEDLVAAIKSRRRRMQAMQNNPKYQE